MIVSVIIAGLASTRLTRAWLHETIGEPFREPVQRWADRVDYTQVRQLDGSKVEMVVSTSNRVLTVKSYVDELINCPHCVGYWFTLGCLLALRVRPLRPLVMALAGATIVSTVADHYPGYDPDEGPDD